MSQTVLFVCTGNSARSIMAEALLNQLGRERFRAYSAGSHPRGGVNPFALETLKRHGIAANAPRSKSWDEFTGLDAPHIDRVITVCDNAAQEACPVFPSAGAREHWSIPDPAAVTGPDARDAFERAFLDLRRRIESLIHG